MSMARPVRGTTRAGARCGSIRAVTVWFYWALKSVLGPVLRSVFRPWVRGGENVPTTGGAILASNHLSFSDSIFLPIMLKRRVTFLAKAEYFTGTGISGWFTRALFTALGAHPVERETHRFVPEEPPPIPRPDLPGRLAWGAVLLGPLALILFVMVLPIVVYNVRVLNQQKEIR